MLLPTSPALRELSQHEGLQTFRLTATTDPSERKYNGETCREGGTGAGRFLSMRTVEISSEVKKNQGNTHKTNHRSSFGQWVAKAWLCCVGSDVGIFKAACRLACAPYVRQQPFSQHFVRSRFLKLRTYATPTPHFPIHLTMSSTPASSRSPRNWSRAWFVRQTHMIGPDQ